MEIRCKNRTQKCDSFIHDERYDWEYHCFA